MIDYRLSDRSSLSLDDVHLPEEVIAPIWSLPRGDEDDARLPTEWQGVTRGQARIYAVVWIEREVTNGGFAQYFWNWGGAFYDAALPGAKAFGLTELEDMLKSAAAMFPGGPPDRIVSKCRAQLRQMAAAQIARDPELAAMLASADPDESDDDSITVLNDTFWKN